MITRWRVREAAYRRLYPLQALDHLEVLVSDLQHIMLPIIEVRLARIQRISHIEAAKCIALIHGYLVMSWCVGACLALAREVNLRVGATQATFAAAGYHSGVLKLLLPSGDLGVVMDVVREFPTTQQVDCIEVGRLRPFLFLL